MKKLIVIFALVAVASGIVVYLQSKQTPAIFDNESSSIQEINSISSETSKKNDSAIPASNYKQTLTQLPDSGLVEAIIIDFTACSEKAFVSTSFGSTAFEFNGIANNKCAFSYGSEVELSGRSWYSCIVPTNLGKKKFSATGVVNLSELDSYCSPR